MLEVYPIAVTTVDWDSYLRSCKMLIGRSVSDSFDEAKMSPMGIASFLVSLGEFAGDERKASQILQDIGSNLQHASVSFLVACLTETLYAFKEETKLKITSADSVHSGFKASIVSGNLQEWEVTIVNCSKEQIKFDVRNLANRFQLYLEQMGLSVVFSKYNKISLFDKTFKLIPRQ